MAYTLHFDTWPHELEDVYEIMKSFGFSEAVAIVRDGDCFFGWGEKISTPSCQAHATITSDDKDLISRLSKWLVNNGFEVVVTDADDWSIVVNDAQFATRYTADHTH